LARSSVRALRKGGRCLFQARHEIELWQTKSNFTTQQLTLMKAEYGTGSRRSRLSSRDAGEVPPTQPAAPVFVYVGSFTGKGEGIYIYQMNPATGALSAVGQATSVANPLFLALDPQKRFLYAIEELAGHAGSVGAFAVDGASGSLTFLNRQSSEGDGPAHLSVEPSGRFVLVANYVGGTVATLPIRPDGQLGPATDVVTHEGEAGPNRERQSHPHPHMILSDPSGRWVLVNDLGLDRTFVYHLDRASGKLILNSPPFAAARPGAGPRHLAFHPSGRYVYVINELDSTLVAFAFETERGVLRPIQTLSTLPKGFAGNNIAGQVLVVPSGKFVYGSNRGYDSVVVFSIHPQSGELTFIGHQWTRGQTPRYFEIDASGCFLLAANLNSDNIVAFRIDLATGKLKPTGGFVPVGNPICIVCRSPALNPKNRASNGTVAVEAACGAYVRGQ